MKISKAQYDSLKERLDNAVLNIGIDRVRHHRKTNNGNDKEMRFRWDLFYASNCYYLFSGDRNINDNHIDTALKKYINGRGDL